MAFIYKKAECARCGEHFYQGQALVWTKGGLLAHVDCPQRNLAEICPVCNLAFGEHTIDEDGITCCPENPRETLTIKISSKRPRVRKLLKTLREAFANGRGRTGHWF